MIATSALIPVVFLDRRLGSAIAVQSGMDVEAAMKIAKAAVDGKLLRLG